MRPLQAQFRAQINTIRDISKLSEISLSYQLVKLRITILKYHSWYLRKISLQIMLLRIHNSNTDATDDQVLQYSLTMLKAYDILENDPK